MSHRLFVGIELPPALRGRLAALQGGVRGARWVPPDTLHITLRFIGEVDRGQANDIADELAGVRAAGFDLRLAGAGTFGAGRRPRALWVGVAPESAPPLSALKRRVDAACARAGLGPDDRRFAPHVTLARLSAGAAGAAERRAGEIAAVADGRFAVGEFVLFESHLGAAGAHYERVARWPLEAA